MNERGSRLLDAKTKTSGMVQGSLLSSTHHDNEFLIKYYLIPSLLMSRSALLSPEEQMKAPQTKISKSY